MEEALSGSSADVRHPSIARKIVLGELRKMTLGRLRLVFPDGTQETIGTTPDVDATIIVKSDQFFKKCLWYGDIGFGESYVDGDWETDSVTHVIKWFILNIDQSPSLSGSRRFFRASNLLKIINRFRHKSRPNSVRKVRRNISEHYDLSNAFFQTFLDRTMTYSSAYFKDQQMSLETAQIAKYDRLCRVAHLEPSDHVLEIGTGWGGFAEHAARNYGCKITTITISQEQFQYAKERIAAAGLSDLVTVRLQDYRHVQGRFDKIVSIEMLEAVGHRYFRTFFQKCHDVLTKGGVLALQVIVCPDSRYDELRRGVDWIQKHIFPGSLLPSVATINRSINATGDLTLFDVKNLGLHYARTLSQWREEFNRNRDQVKSLGFGDSFVRKWNYYLSYCEAAFSMRNINVMQMVFARPNTMHL